MQSMMEQANLELGQLYQHNTYLVQLYLQHNQNYVNQPVALTPQQLASIPGFRDIPQPILLGLQVMLPQLRQITSGMAERSEANQSFWSKNKYGFELPLGCTEKRWTGNGMAVGPRVGPGQGQAQYRDVPVPCTPKQFSERVTRNAQRLERLNRDRPLDTFGFVDDQLTQGNLLQSFFV